MLSGDGESRRTDDASATETNSRRPSTKRLKLFASVLGLLGTVLALSVPFLPVDYNVTTLKWPTAEGTKDVSAPLVAYEPLWLKADVPCPAARSLDARTNGPAVLLSTNPPNSDYGDITGMVLQVDNGQLTLLMKGQQLGSVALPAGDCSVSVNSTAYGLKATAGDETLVNIAGDRRPQVTGIFSSLDEARDDISGLSFQARVDTRYESQPTPLKLAAIAGAVLCFLGGLVCLRRLDVRAGRRPPRWFATGWWRPTLRDVAVLGSLLIWWVIGAMTSDDGYILNIARARESFGYISNYYRWFGVPEAPFGWFYELYALWVKVFTATPWVRLPALLMAVISWLLISREVLPRLGQQVRRSHAAGWAAAAVFLAFWLPYNNGLRPEPVVVLFSLLALCAVERAVATNRLMPAALGLLVAALSVGANPHGMVSVLPFIAAAKPLFRLVRKRANEFGWLPVLAPIAASGFVILTLVFSDQTWKSVMDATELRTDIGPSQSWYEELSRYTLLFSQTPDGSMTRRFPVLLVILCLVTCAVVLLRRGKIRGSALGPSRRLLAVTAMSFAVLVLTPTKWTHHFGIFAAFGGALAALTALATSSTVLRSKRNRAVFVAGLMMILAFATTGPNAWWYVSGWGVPWFNMPPQLKGYHVSTMLLVIAGISLIVAFVEHLRIDEHNPKVVDERFDKNEGGGRALRMGTAPLSIVCALLVLVELANFGKVIHKQWGSYSLGADNIKQITGYSCGLSDYIYVETNPQYGMLRVSDSQPSVAAPSQNEDVGVPPRRLEGKEDAAQYLKAKLTGFDLPGLPPGDGSDPQEPDWNPPHNFGDDNAPVWGSYDPKGVGTGELRTQWYDLPERARNGEVPVVLSLAGTELGANSVALEFGHDTPNGFLVTERKYVAQSGAPSWRDFRYTLGEKEREATKMRVVAVDNALGPRGWVAVSAPRAPQLVNMTDFVGDQPAFVEWTAALVHPCLQLPTVHHGVAEIPKFRVAAGAEVRDVGQGWSSPDAGGPFGWLSVATSMRELPTYLKNNIHRDWGSLYAVDPYEPDALPAQAAMEVHTETHWGTWTPGPLTKTVQLPGDVPSSDDRNDVKNFAPPEGADSDQ
ncbi:arabinosyltransferase domain-containing protein [Saccharopolyspora griseoalba]|uniref:Arabinosyltransferase domain-containing protein n=1 Tax=Saccharopolyspora griseoalba TaxID=1431848 RepID=A0ABW2LKR3_9PSEU